MSKSTISTFRLFELFPNEETARTYLEGRIWPSGPVCPDCYGDRITTRKRVGFYHCNDCNFDFTVRTRTIFERSKVPLHKWVYAMYLLVTARKGISSLQLSKEIGVTQKTAWFILGRLREACSAPDSIDRLKGIVEIDECFVGGLEANKHEHKKLKAGRGSVGKVAVLGMRERGVLGRVHATVIPDTGLATIQNEIHGAVEVGSQLYTDEHGAYSDLDGLYYDHATVNHGAGEYVRGAAHTNGIESVWAVLKRGLHGVYHHASPQHLFRYVDEFTWRLNEGNVIHHTLNRLAAFVDATVGKRLTYNRLIGKVGVQA
jgi:transposase-like protein